MGAIQKGGKRIAFKDFLGAADYSVGDPPTTHVRGLGLSPKYSFFMSSPKLPQSSQNFVWSGRDTLIWPDLVINDLGHVVG